MLRKLVVNAFLFLAVSTLASAQAARHVTFHYGFTVKQVPAGERVRIWFPAAQADSYQEVRVVSATGDLPLKKTRESRFGNEIYYAETAKAKATDLHFEVVYDVVRHEHLTLGLNHPRLQDVSLKRKEAEQLLAPGGGAATFSTLAMPRKAIALTFIPCSSLWPVPSISRHVSRWDSRCLPTRAQEKLPATIVGRSSLIRKMDGSRWTFPKPGNTRKRETTSSAHMTLNECNFRSAAT